MVLRTRPKEQRFPEVRAAMQIGVLLSPLATEKCKQTSQLSIKVPVSTREEIGLDFRGTNWSVLAKLLYLLVN